MPWCYKSLSPLRVAMSKPTSLIVVLLTLAMLIQVFHCLDYARMNRSNQLSIFSNHLKSRWILIQENQCQLRTSTFKEQRWMIKFSKIGSQIIFQTFLKDSHKWRMQKNLVQKRGSAKSTFSLQSKKCHPFTKLSPLISKTGWDLHSCKQRVISELRFLKSLE